MASAAILKPYERRRPPGRLSRILWGAGLVFLAAFYGLMSTILPPQLLAVPAVPILLMVALTLWLLPDIGVMHQGFLAKAMILYVGLNILWPNFVAFNLPGLPWITPTRVVVFAMLAVFLVDFSTSAELRSKVVTALGSDRWIGRLFLIFWASTTLSLVFSDQLGFSVSRYMNDQIYWTMMFAMSAWLATAEGFVARFARVMAWSVILVALVGLWEYRMQAMFWVPWLPGFLKADSDTIGRLLTFSARAGSNVYRVRGTLGGSLYFAEYLAISFPFVLHALAIARRPAHAILLILACIAMMAVMVFTDSRSAAGAMLLSPLLYGFLAAWRARRNNSQSLGANSVVYAYPMMAVVLAIVVVAWRRLHVMVIGGGQHAASSGARTTQWSMGLPKIASHPLGHGVSTSGEVLGYFNPGHDSPTVDSGFLSILLDYGVIGLAAFLAMIGGTIWRGFIGYVEARCPDTMALAPITVALSNYLIIKAVSSTEINFPIVLIMIGCVLGLLAREVAAGKVPGQAGGAPQRAPGRQPMPA